VRAATPQITVVVPLFNKQQTIRRTLASIRSQTFGAFEAIVVDDGSTDDSLAETRKYLAEIDDGRFRIVQQSNLGPGAARNTGLHQALAPLIAFLDADDEWLPAFLERAVQALGSNPDAACVTFSWYDEPGHRLGDRTIRKQWGLDSGLYVLTAETPPRVLLGLSVAMWSCATVVRRATAIQYQGFYERRCRYGEDAHLWVKIALNHPILLQWDPLALFHRDSSSLSGNYRRMRPIEPFLSDPDDLSAVCPSGLKPLLREFLAIRALKTACVLGYWSHWREACAMWRSFTSIRHGYLKHYWLAMFLGTPVGSLVASMIRRLRPAA
jgi:GT2 family glycosyltransferase